MWGQSLHGSGNVWVLIVIIWLNKISPPARQLKFQLPQYMTREQLYKLWGACFGLHKWSHRNQSHIMVSYLQMAAPLPTSVDDLSQEDTAQKSSRPSLRNKPMWSVTENGKKIATKDKSIAKEGKVASLGKRFKSNLSGVREEIANHKMWTHSPQIYYGYALGRTQWRQIQEHKRAKWVGQEG